MCLYLLNSQHDKLLIKRYKRIWLHIDDNDDCYHNIQYPFWATGGGKGDGE